MCSWIILICNGGASTCAKCSDLNKQTKIVWGTSTVTAYDISSYTLGQIKYITSTTGSVLSCGSDSNTITFVAYGDPIRVLFGGGPVGNDECCSPSNPRGMCNAPNKQNDMNELCRNLGYSSSTIDNFFTAADCPAASFSNEIWTSDFGPSNLNYVDGFICTGCGVPDPPLSDAPTAAPTKLSVAPTPASNTPTQATRSPTQAPSLTTISPTQDPSLATISPTQTPSLTTIYPTQSPSRDSSELIHSKENTQSSEAQSHSEDSIQHTSETGNKNVKKSTPQNKNKRNLLSVHLNHNPTHTKEYSKSIVTGTESLQQVEMLHLTKIIYEMVIGSIILITIFIYYTYTHKSNLQRKEKDNDYEPLISDNV